jgi:hypothetical protein
MLWIDNSNRFSMNGAGSVIEPSSPVADGSTWRVISNINRGSGTRSEQRIDGTGKGTAGESVGALNVGTGLTLRLLGRSSGNGLQGDVAEIVVTYGALTTDDEARIEGYLAWRYGLQSQLDSGHAYKSAAPTDGSSDSTGTGTGSGAASGIGAALFAGTGSGSGTGATGAVAGATHAGTGAATGVGALSMTGAAHWAATGSTAGAGAAAGVGDSATVGIALGAATGSSTSSMAGAAVGAAVGAADGVSTVAGTGATHFAGTGSAAGSAITSGVGSAASRGTGTTIGTAVAAGVSASWVAAQGSASGVGAASATGASSAAGVGAATGSSTSSMAGGGGGGSLEVIESISASSTFTTALQSSIHLSEVTTASYTINSYSLAIAPILVTESSTASEIANNAAVFNNALSELGAVDYVTSTTNLYSASLTEPITSSFNLYNQITYNSSLTEPLTSNSTFTPVTFFNPALSEALSALATKTALGAFSISVSDPLAAIDVVQYAAGPLDFDLIIPASADFQQSNTFIGNDTVPSAVNAAYENDFTVTFTFSLSETVTAQDAVQTTNADLNITVVENLANVNDTVFDNLSSEFEVYVVEQAIASFECIVGATPAYPIQEELNAQDSLSTTVVYELHVKEGPLRPMVDVVPHMINHIIVDVNSPATDFIDWGFVQADINKEQEPEHLGGSLIEARKQKPRLIPHA